MYYHVSVWKKQKHTRTSHFSFWVISFISLLTCSPYEKRKVFFLKAWRRIINAPKKDEGTQIQFTVCWVTFLYLVEKQGLTWISRNTSVGKGMGRREGLVDYIRISLLWLISSALFLPLSLPVCLFVFFSAWLHQLVTWWKSVQNGCQGSSLPHNASVLSHRLSEF